MLGSFVRRRIDMGDMVIRCLPLVAGAELARQITVLLTLRTGL